MRYLAKRHDGVNEKFTFLLPREVSIDVKTELVPLFYRLEVGCVGQIRYRISQLG